ncbi:methylated-DNA--[protein]-cysteine S-methyltransferase [Selenomonas sp.]|uniref:methylated-DNA--[protein]-cysteine S-methyltransferase n=1 Tax=Selenomonas sp. TaxID=2053611 RepID=UPI00345B9927
MVSDGTALTSLVFMDRHVDYTGVITKKLPIFADTERWLDLYFNGIIPDFTPELSLRGTSFRLSVWEILCRIPYGQTISYGEIAALLTEQRDGKRMSAQAVGGAVGANPIAIFVPCHRVIGKDGSLTGYAGGIERKKWLLAMEQKFR